MTDGDNPRIVVRELQPFAYAIQVTIRTDHLAAASRPKLREFGQPSRRADGSVTAALRCRTPRARRERRRLVPRSRRRGQLPRRDGLHGSVRRLCGSQARESAAARGQGVVLRAPNLSREGFPHCLPAHGRGDHPGEGEMVRRGQLLGGAQGKPEPSALRAAPPSASSNELSGPGVCPAHRAPTIGLDWIARGIYDYRASYVPDGGRTQHPPSERRTRHSGARAAAVQDDSHRAHN